MLKPWNSNKNKNKREINKRNIRKILIVCEGEKTEPNYFKNFPLDKEIIDVDIEETGMNTLSLVKYAIELRDKAELDKNPYIEVWCVFDEDNTPHGNFDNAISCANNRIKVAWSNEAFELWYILHFEYLQSAITRHRYCSKLTEILKNKCNKKKYEKNSTEMYSILKSRQKDAIENAKKLCRIHIDIPPSKCKPCTTVYMLVERLNEFIENNK